MPSMMNIYKKYSKNYDELVNAEDYQENLKSYIENIIDWKGKIVYEAGIGTGRVTKFYIDKVKYCFGFDREEHMLEKCKNNLSLYKDRISLNIAENSELKSIDKKMDVFIEGWSFGHTIIENAKIYKKTFQSIFKFIESGIKENGIIILIESLGTNFKRPKVKNRTLKRFYKILEKEYNFKKEIIRTDYKFDNYIEAGRIMSFFFGEEMYTKIYREKQCVIPEYTGVWVKKMESA